jgi:hypothetical protein
MPLKGLRLSALMVVSFGAALLLAAERPATAWTYIPIIYAGGSAPPPPATNATRGNPNSGAEGPVAHAAPPPPPAGPKKYRVIMRDGSAVLARDLPKVVAGTVRFTDDRGGMLVAIKASLVDLAATAEANRLKWEAVPPAGGSAAAAARAPEAAKASAAPVQPPH